MKKLIIILLFAVAAIKGFSQYDAEQVNKKAAALYTKALQQASDGKFREAINILQDAVKIDSRFLDAYLSIAGIYGELKDYNNAINNYEKAQAIDNNYFRDYSLPYSINLAGAGNFEKALAAANSFLSISNLNPSSRKAGEYRKQCYSFALEYEKQRSLSSYKFEPKESRR